MTLYDYQEECVDLCLKNDKGIICLVTGTGKTIVESAVLSRTITSNPGFSIYVVNAPRIILTYQLMLECYKYLVSSNIEVFYYFVHSGSSVEERDLEKIRLNSEVPYSQVLSGTSTVDIKTCVDKAKRLNIPVIFFSTYHSANRIYESVKDTEEISIIINDEAHYLVQEQFHKLLTDVKANKWLFFTATLLFTPGGPNSGRGMQNETLYGKVLYSLSPRQAIEKGRIIRPRLHLISTNGVHTMEDYYASISKVIKNGYLQHRSVLTINPKLLVSVKGVAHMLKFLHSQEYKDLRNLGVDIFSISSNVDVGNDINGIKYTRPEFLKILKEYGEDSKRSILILHYSIMTEGIDVSGISGILLLRSLSKASFLQTYGRCARLDPYDRQRLTNGEIQPNDLSEFVKPYGFIIIANITHDNDDDSAYIHTIVQEMREYSFVPVEEIISSSIVNGVIKPEILDNLNDIKTKSKTIGTIIEKYVSSLEDERIASLNQDDWLDNLLE